MRWHFGGLLKVTDEKVLARTQVSSLNVHGLHGEISRDRIFFHLDKEMDISFLYFSLNTSKFYLGSLIEMWRYLGSEVSIGHLIWERRTADISLQFWKYFGLNAFVRLSFFSLLLFYLFKCLLPKSPLWIWKAQKGQGSRLLNCGTELKEEMGTFRPPLVCLGSGKVAGIWGRSSAEQ